MTSHTEPAVVDGVATEIGRDPRHMAAEELNALGHHKRPLLAAIRQNCLDCVGDSPLEVRRCRMVTCPFWPYRMNSNPFRAPISGEKREAMAARLSAYRESVASQSKQAALDATDE